MDINLLGTRDYMAKQNQHAQSQPKLNEINHAQRWGLPSKITSITITRKREDINTERFKKVASEA